MKTSIQLLAVAIVTLLLSQVPASAQSILPRSPSYSLADDQSIDDEDVINVYMHRDRSYECGILALDFSANTDDEFYIFNSTVMDPDGGSFVATANGDDYPAISPVDGVSMVHNRARLSLTAQKTGIYKMTVEDAFNLNNSEPNTVRCRETTLYGGYNRYFAGVAIIEINNAGNKQTDVRISIKDSNGNTVIDAQEATAKANTRTDVIFANLPAASFGQIQITHEAPFGALSGTVAEYDYAPDGSITLKRERPLTTAQRR